MKYDALGNEIKIGEVYGYSNTHNGFLKVIIGEAVKIGDSRVTIKILHRGSAYYEDKVKREKEDDRFAYTRGKVSVRANLLFPLDNYQLNWDED